MRRPRTSTALLACALVVASLVGVPSVASAVAVVPDGSSAGSAAASCWEVKQVAPSSPDGVY
ncbi:MAG: hypothetical protein NTV28_15830, partial [Propionibacteriales bacterium]|nr:hypothetical protein [Propionibacteriales bacterium]